MGSFTVTKTSGRVCCCCYGKTADQKEKAADSACAMIITSGSRQFHRKVDRAYREAKQWCALRIALLYSAVTQACLISCFKNFCKVVMEEQYSSRRQIVVSSIVNLQKDDNNYRPSNQRFIRNYGGVFCWVRTVWTWPFQSRTRSFRKIKTGFTCRLESDTQHTKYSPQISEIFTISEHNAIRG